MAVQPLFSVKQSEKCPECEAELVIRSGAKGAFLGCSRYPECNFVRSLKPQSEGHVIKVLEEQMCPNCQCPLVLRQGRYGMFICCSDYPVCPHTEPVDKPDQTAITCPLCKHGYLLQRKSRFGKTFHACDRYPTCRFTLNFLPVAGECEFCHYPLLQEKKTAQGVKRFCANKFCGLPVKPDSI